MAVVPLALTDEQTALTESMLGFAQRNAPLDKTRAAFDALAAGERPLFWDALVAQGFHTVQLPESVGGQGGSVVDAAGVLDAAGYALLPGSLLTTVIAGTVVNRYRSASTAAALLSEIAAGATAVVVLPEAGTLTAESVDGGWSLSGRVGPDVGLCAAERIVISAEPCPGAGSADARLWFVLDTAGPDLRIAAETATDLTRDVGVLTVSGHVVDRSALLEDFDADWARRVAVTLTAAEATGVARWCVDSVLDHLRVREQFGKPIGAFQALQHKAARLYVAAELATAAAWDAARSLEQPADQQQAAVAAAAVAVAGLPDLVLDALTMFGAIGYTWEHDVHLYWRRAMSLAATVGPAGDWATQLGSAEPGARDFAVESLDVDGEFRARVVAVLDRAAALTNDTPGRESPDYVTFESGPQRDLLAEAGLLVPHLPAPWGLDAGPAQQLIIAEEFDKRPQVIRSSLGIAEWILPTILLFGSDQQRQRFAEPTLRGTLAWCQLFSEPGAGSDLASLSTRATKVDGGWVITGQKVWTSAAHRADWGALLARTDPEVAKHKGIGYFLLDMSTPGITIRPLRTVTGEAHFNEVFFDEVFIPDELLVGEPGGGWSLALATMANERAAISGYINNDRESVLRDLVDAPGVDRAAAVRALGEVRADTNAIAALNLRDILSRLAGHAPGPATSIAKVATGQVLRRIATHAAEFAGRSSLVAAPGDTAVAYQLQLPAELIGGGTMEIQLNIIATMILGLPRG